LRRDFPALSQLKLELAIALRIGVLATLTVWVLLLLARLLTATLLLTGLLTRVLVLLARVLLARVLVRVRHRTSPLHVERSWRQPTNPPLVSEKTRFRRDHCVAAVWRDHGPGTEAKLASLKPMYKPWKPQFALLPHRVPAVRK
jgi:hypothetical protein